MALLVHGIVRTGSLAGADLAEATDADVDLVSHGDLAGVVTPASDGEIMPSRANLLRHTSVLEAAIGMTTVLPMRFGIAVPDEEALVREYLDPEQDALLAALERLDDHVEVRVRGRFDEQAVLQLVVAADPLVAKLRGRSGMDTRMELGERVVHGIEAQRDRHQQVVIEALLPPATDVAPARVSDPLEAFLISFLVDRRKMGSFEHDLGRLVDRFEPVVDLELIGPLPPFSFAATGEA